jgi:hypothetical protein
MLTIEDLLLQFRSKTDEELFQVYLAIDDYSDEAKEAIEMELRKRGGLDKVKAAYEVGRRLLQEQQRIMRDTYKLAEGGTDISLLKTLITSELFAPEQTHALVEEAYAQKMEEIADRKVKPRTVYGSMIGGLAGSIVGGLLWGILAIQTQRIFYFLFAVMALISYGLIRLFTRQSKENTVVAIATGASVIIGVIIGNLLYNWFG